MFALGREETVRSGEAHDDQPLSGSLTRAAKVIGAGLWLLLCWIVFFPLPLVKEWIVDFDLNVGPVTMFVVEHGMIGFAIIAVAGVISIQRKGMEAYVLVWVPLLLLSCLFVIIGIPLLRLLFALN